MNALPPPDLFPSPSAADRVDVPVGTRITHPAALFGVALAVGLVAAAAAGGGMGWIVASITNADCSPHDGWCRLGGLIAGLLVGAVTAVVTYVVSGVAVIARCRPRRGRAAFIAAHLAAPVVVASVVGVLASVV